MIGAALLERRLDAKETALMRDHILYSKDNKICAMKFEDNECETIVEHANDAIFGVCFDDPSKAVIGYVHQNEPDRVWFVLVEESGESVRASDPIFVKLDIPEEYLDDASTYLAAASCGGDIVVVSAISEVSVETDSFGLSETVPVYATFIALKISNGKLEEFKKVRYNASKFRIYPYGIGCLGGICFFSMKKMIDSKRYQRIIIATRPMEVNDIKTIQLRDIIITDDKDAKIADNGFGAFTLSGGETVRIYTIDAMLNSVWKGKIVGTVVQFSGKTISKASASWRPKLGSILAVRIKDAESKLFWVAESGKTVEILATEEPSLVGYVYFTDNDRLLLSTISPELFRLLMSELVKKT